MGVGPPASDFSISGEVPKFTSREKTSFYIGSSLGILLVVCRALSFGRQAVFHNLVQENFLRSEGHDGLRHGAEPGLSVA